MRALLHNHPRGHGHLEPTVDGIELKFRAGRKAQLLAKGLRDDQSSGAVNGGSHGIKIPLPCH